MFNRMIWLGLALMFITLWACAPKPAPIASEIKPEPEVAALVAKEASWGLEWEKTLAKAKKEGKAVIYTSRGPEARQALMEGFKKRTGLDLDMTAGKAAEIMAKIQGERRAGLYLVDAIISAPSTMLATLPKEALRPIVPELFLPEVVDTSLWYKGRLPFADRENNLILQTRLSPAAERVDGVYNTNLISKKEIASWYDLLKPQFKGTMNMMDPTMGKGFQSVYRILSLYGLDWDYMRALAGQEPFIIRDERLQIEWVAQGKHLVGISPDGKIIDAFKRAGAPVDFVTFKETTPGMGGGSFALALPAKPSNPNAAKIFANWFLSKEGQTIFSRATLYQSAREDVPTEHLLEGRIRQPGVDYFIEDEEWVTRGNKEFLPKVRELFAPLLR